MARAKAKQKSAEQIRKEGLAGLAEQYTGDTYPEEKVRVALDLDSQKVALYEAIAVNRRQLRDMVAAGDLAADDVEIIYSTKTMKRNGADDPDAVVTTDGEG